MNEKKYSVIAIILAVCLTLLAVGAGILIYSLSTSPSQNTDEATPPNQNTDETIPTRRPFFIEAIPATTTTILGNWESPPEWSSSVDAPICAIHNDGTISCWGNNKNGLLGSELLAESSDTRASGPVKVAGIDDAIAITLGRTHSCALHSDGTVSCWGKDGWNALGNGFDSDPEVQWDGEISYTPIKILDADDNHLNNINAISVGDGYTCAVHNDGTISCWGIYESGELGDGSGDSNRFYWGTDVFDKFGSTYPVKVSGINDAIDISVGFTHACALHEDTTISCWGDNRKGQIGNGTYYNQTTPAKVRGSNNTIIEGFTSVSASGEFTCAIHNDETVSCWGGDFTAVLRDVDEPPKEWPWEESSTPPRKILNANNEPLSNVTAISTMYPYACALHTDKTVTCWDAENVEKIPAIQDAIEISLNGVFCTLHTDQTVYCWGKASNSNIGYQIGYITSDVQALASR